MVTIKMELEDGIHSLSSIDKEDTELITIRELQKKDYFNCLNISVLEIILLVKGM